MSATNYPEIVKTWTDDMLAGALAGTTQALRDGNGSLRSLTETEREFLDAVQAERGHRATTTPNTDREVAVSTFSISCPCQCGAVVEARDAGFSATTVEIDTCEAWRAVSGGYHAPMAIEVRKSVAYSQAVPTTVISHRDGLVSFSA